MRRRLLPSLLTSVILTACGAAVLPPMAPHDVLTLSPVASRQIATLTDVEDFRDVAVMDGAVFAATDHGLIRFNVENGSSEVIEALRGRDIAALTETDQGLLVATHDALFQVQGEEVTELAHDPDVGHVRGLTRTSDGTVWLCGLGGLARFQGQTWEMFGDAVACTTLAATPEGNLWVGTVRGMLYVEGEVIREHAISGGIPEGYVRSIIPVLPGEAMALVQGPQHSQLAYWDGVSWYGYTLRGLAEAPIGLVRAGAQLLLVTQHRVLAITPEGEGMPLTALSHREGTVRSFRAHTTPISEHRPSDVPDPDVLRDPSSLLDVPLERPSVSAPLFHVNVVPVDMHGRAYHAFAHGGDAFLAITNGGLIHMDASNHVVYRTHSLVPEEDLQIATDARGGVWVLSREHHLMRFLNDRLRSVSLPDGHRALAITSGPAGAYAIARPSAESNELLVYVNRGPSWDLLIRRTLQLETALVDVPFMGVAPDRTVWAALRVARAEGEGARMRGFALMTANDQAVRYYHRAADREAGGLPMPDEVSRIEFDTRGNAWVASLSGLVRVGEQQAVVFGESRGVRGEVVNDLALGSGEIWVAAGEGLLRYDLSEFSGALPPVVQNNRPHQLAVDLAGHVWGTTRSGLLLHEGNEWLLLGADAGLPTVSLRDVDVDGAGRVWLLAEGEILVLEP